MFTTPNTISVPPEYEIETDVPSVAEFVTCSLDGRLWIWRRSRRYYVAVFRWNEETEKLVFVNTTILNGETVIKRGVDWILTDKSLILSSDDEPYISRTEYESSDTTYTDTINKSYSFFPELETWQEIQSGQVIRVADAPNQALQVISQSLLTPLEFHYYSDDDIQAVTEFNPQLCYCNGQLYGKGKAHIGRAYLLPRTFKENGDVENFYLYVSPDYLRSYDKTRKKFNDNDGWDNLILAPLNSNSVCSFTPANGDYGLCKKAENGQVLSFPQIEQLDYSANNGAIFFDGLTGSNLMLNDNGASLLRDSLSYECKGLSQWIAPSGKVDVISPQYAISSFDTGTLATFTQQGLHRELLTQKTIPLTAKDYTEKRLSLGEADKNSKKFIHVNSVKGDNDIALVDWQNIYIPSNIEIKAIHFLDTHSFRCNLVYNGPDYSWSDKVPYYPIFILNTSVQAHGWDDKNFCFTTFDYVRGYGTDSLGHYVSPALSHLYSFEGFGINPDTEEIFNFFANEIHFGSSIPIENGRYQYWDANAQVDVPTEVTVMENGEIGIIYIHYTNGGRSREIRVKKTGEIPPQHINILNWQRFPAGYDNKKLVGNLFFQDILFPENINGVASAVFIEKNTHRQIYCSIPSALSKTDSNISGILSDIEKPYVVEERKRRIDNKIYDFGNFWNITSFNDDSNFYTECLHVARVIEDSSQDTTVRIITFKSKIHPEIFDFASEVERSKLL